jgi:hypothetical protein
VPAPHVRFEFEFRDGGPTPPSHTLVAGVACDRAADFVRRVAVPAVASVDGPGWYEDWSRWVMTVIGAIQTRINKTGPWCDESVGAAHYELLAVLRWDHRWRSCDQVLRLSYIDVLDDWSREGPKVELATARLPEFWAAVLAARDLRTLR